MGAEEGSTRRRWGRRFWQWTGRDRFETGVHSGDGQVTITYTANPTPPNPTPTASQDPKCKKLRKKLKRQQQGLAKAGSEAKRAMIQANIKDTKKRLKKRGCSLSR